MLTVSKDRGDDLASARMWMTNELPDDIDDWPDGWRDVLEARQDALADSPELGPGEARALAEGLVRRQFRYLAPALELL